MSEFPVGFTLPDGIMFYIGNFVALFSRIEGAASFALWKQSGLDSRAASAFVNNMVLKEKLAALRALSAQKVPKATAIEKSDYKNIERWMKYTEAVLIPERNRIVHDEWHSPIGGGLAARRVKQHSLVKTPQSFKIEVEYSLTKHVDTNDLQDLCTRTNGAAFALGILGYLFGPQTPGMQMIDPPPPFR